MKKIAPDTVTPESDNSNYIRLSPLKGTVKYQDEIDILLKLIGEPEAFITDETTFEDFFNYFDEDDLDWFYQRCGLFRLAFGFIILPHDTLVDVARIMRDHNENMKLPE